MKVEITEFNAGAITFLEEGVKELQTVGLASWVKPGFVKLGKAEISIKDNEVTFVAMESDHPADKGTDQKVGTKKKPGIDMVSYEDLRKAAFKKAEEAGERLNFSSMIKRDGDGKLMIDFEKKMVLYKAVITLTKGEKVVARFEGHGDTLATNIEGNSAKHWIRLGETRAYSRALRWYTNLGCAEEEK